MSVLTWGGLWARILIGINSSSLLVLWISLELNLLIFVGVITLEISERSLVKLKYFIVQRLGSRIIFMSIIGHNVLSGFFAVFALGVAVKLAIAPAHLWLLEILRDSRAKISSLIITVQKILPLILLTNILSYNVSEILVFSRVLFGAAGALVEQSWKLIMGYSSVFRNSWLLLRKDTLERMLGFLITYRVSLRIIFYLARIANKTVELSWAPSITGPVIGLMFFNLMRIRGIPPFIGFYFKVIILTRAVQTWRFLISSVVLVRSISMTYLYVRLFYVLCVGRAYTSLIYRPRFVHARAYLLLRVFPLVLAQILRVGVHILRFELKVSN